MAGLAIGMQHVRILDRENESWLNWQIECQNDVHDGPLRHGIIDGWTARGRQVPRSALDCAGILFRQMKFSERSEGMQVAFQTHLNIQLLFFPSIETGKKAKRRRRLALPLLQGTLSNL